MNCLLKYLWKSRSLKFHLAPVELGTSGTVCFNFNMGWFHCPKPDYQDSPFAAILPPLG